MQNHTFLIKLLCYLRDNTLIAPADFDNSDNFLRFASYMPWIIGFGMARVAK